MTSAPDEEFRSDRRFRTYEAFGRLEDVLNANVKPYEAVVHAEPVVLKPGVPRGEGWRVTVDTAPPDPSYVG